LLQRRVVVTALLSMALPVSALPPLPQFISYFMPNGGKSKSKSGGKPVFLPPYKYFGQFGVRCGNVSVHHPDGGPFDSVAEAQAAVQARQAAEGYVGMPVATQRSSVKGVYFDSRKEHWQAKVMGKLAARLNNGNKKALGTFKDREDAERCLAAWITARENGEVRWIPCGLLHPRRHRRRYVCGPRRLRGASPPW
jgi:hypothetical protein